MIGESHATFISRWCLHEIVSRRKSYDVLVVFFSVYVTPLENVFNHWCWDLESYILNDRQCSPAFVNFVRVQFEKIFCVTKFLRCESCCTVLSKSRNTLNRMLLREGTFFTECKSERVLCKMLCSMYGTVFVIKTFLWRCKATFRLFSSWGNARIISACSCIV